MRIDHAGVQLSDAKKKTKLTQVIKKKKIWLISIPILVCGGSEDYSKMPINMMYNCTFG